MRSSLDLLSARAVPPLAFIGDGLELLAVAVTIVVLATGAFLCLVAYDLNTDFRRFDKRDAKRAKANAHPERSPRPSAPRPAPTPVPVPADEAVR